MKAIILAGGKGTRLRPYTTVFPKPLVPVENYPILEIVVRQLKHNGFNDITLAVGHMSELIKAYFGNGEKWNVNIHYSQEQQPLGTIGPLKLIDQLDENFLVLNSDDLTDLSYSGLLDFHIQNNAAATIAMFPKSVKIDLGVLSVDGSNKLLDYIEKPEYNYMVSMGIYALNKRVVELIPSDKKFDFPELIKVLLDKGEKVQCYQNSSYWLDIGRPEDYERCNEDFPIFKASFLKDIL